MICNNVTGLGIVDPKALPLSDYLPFHMRYLSVIGTMMENYGVMAVKDEAVYKRIVMGVTIVLKLPINVSTAAVKVFIK